MVIIRQEQPADIAAIGDVTQQAFGHPAEAHLIEALRARGQIALSLVAEHTRHIVGHCLFSPVTLASAGKAWAMVGLGPMAVLPRWQRQGIGSRLIMHGLEHCRRQGYDGVVVLGHPAYYPRFGFVPASRYNIRCVYGVPDDVFMVLELRPGALQGCEGTAMYQPEFNAV